VLTSMKRVEGWSEW